MKRLIVPIAIIAVLIAFFVIIDHKESDRADAVQTVQDVQSSTNRTLSGSDSENTPVTPVADQTSAEAHSASNTLINSEMGGVKPRV